MSVLSYLEKRASDALLDSAEKESIKKSIATLKARLDAYFGDKLKEYERQGLGTKAEQEVKKLIPE